MAKGKGRGRKGLLPANLADHAEGDFDKETIENLSAARAKENAKIGHNSGEPSDEVIKRNKAAIELGLRAILAAQKLVQKAREEFSTTRSTAETDMGSKGWVNSTVKAMKLKIQGERGGVGEMVTEHRQIGRVLRLDDDCPLGTQYGLFAVADAPATEGAEAKPGMDAELQGQHAYSNGEKPENNPFQAGTQAHQDWSVGYYNAQAAKARSMGDVAEATH